VPSAVRRPPDEELARELIEEVLSDPHPVGEFLAEDLGEGAGLVYQREFTASLELRPKERPRTDDAKRDTWLVMMSQAVERDLGPFLELWGVPVSPEARGRVARYPEWLPEKRGAR
jgi:hypothetical protein